MARVTTISITLLFLATFLCLQARSLPFLSSSPIQIPTINAKADNSGKIDIKRDSTGFYVEADFTFDPILARQPLPDPLPLDTVKMVLSLSNSQTIATSNCLNFSDYNSSRYNWRYNMWETVVSYPNLMAHHSIAGYANVYLDNKYWALTDNILLIASMGSCETGANASLISSDRYGVLGLGFQDRGTKNFKVSKNFSIYINPDLTSGKIIFTNDTNNFTVPSEPVYKLSADANWRINIPRGHVIVKNYSADFNYGDAIFDINSDAIGLPYDLFKWFINNFNLVSGISCNSDLYKPDCKTNGTVNGLPDIFLSFNDTKVRIPPKIYVIPNGKSNFKLNLKAISPDLSGPSYVTLDFKDSIIFDANFMSYYFTVFDATSGSSVISLYPTVLESNYKWIVIGSVAIVFLVIIVCCVKRKIAANKLSANIAKESFAYNYTAYNQRINPN